MSTVPDNAPLAADVELAAGLTSTSDSELECALRHFEATADGLGARRPSSDELTKLTNQVVGFTRELFPGKLIIETEVDPEMQDDVCLVFQVEAAGTVKEILALEDVWLRRLISHAPQWPGLFRLSIDAR